MEHSHPGNAKAKVQHRVEEVHDVLLSLHPRIVAAPGDAGRPAGNS